jgi:hypothetical protein
LAGADKLPTRSGGGAAFCAAVQRSAVATLPNAAFSVAVRVIDRATLVAAVKLPNGRELPPMTMTQTDREITRSSLERFGAAVVTQVASARAD